jgi:arylsulfatase A-like enzyme
MPTILDICGIDLNSCKQMQGFSLLRLINENDERFKNRFIISEFIKHPQDNYARAIRNKENKLIVTKHRDKVEFFLFDLRTDPQEQVNIVENDPRTKNYLLQQLDEFIYNLPRYGIYSKSAIMDNETRKRLKALGYIN